VVLDEVRLFCRYDGLWDATVNVVALAGSARWPRSILCTTP